MGPAKENSGRRTNPVLSVTEVIHGEAKGEVNGQFGAPSVYLNEHFLFLFSSNLVCCLLRIFKTYQLSNSEANQL